MHYLTIDGMMSGTGIRDAVEGGYLQPSALGVSEPLQVRISRWLAQYEEAHFRQYDNSEEVTRLDAEGLEITRLIRAELSDAKVHYFSNARMMKLAG